MIIKKHARLIHIIIDLSIIMIATVFSSYLISGVKLISGLGISMIGDVALFMIIYVVVFYIMKVYDIIWSLAGYLDYMNLTFSNIIASCIMIIYNNYIMNNTVFPLEILIVSSGIILLASLSYRMFIRISKRFMTEKHIRSKLNDNTKKVLIIGAGQAAAMIIKEICTHPELNMRIIGMVDDEDFKQHSRISGYNILGRIKDVPEIVKNNQVDEVLFAIPSATHEERRKILDSIKTSTAKLKTLPGLYEIVETGMNIKTIRDVEIADLLGRKEIHLNNEETSEYIEGKIVLVTGGGGSIGSELCRQIAKFHPSKLIIVDIYENSAYSIQNELKRVYPELDLLVLIASVRDKKKIDNIFNTYRPQTVFHAAAHKHVPLMETSPDEAIKNNVFGTLNTAIASNRYRTEKFILISTDKAVNPTNIMGATKRLCEMIIQTTNVHSECTNYVAVRFGNVLGSNGSVIPVFKEQIAKGGPITLTHRDINRYFMTIPEAVQLVLQAGSYASGGEIFVLDMGEPVKIYDLAENLIRLSGFEPHEDIEIEITGLRPGEKLYEELLMDEEGLETTPNKLIFVGRPNDFKQDILMDILNQLKEEIDNENLTQNEIKLRMREIVPTYVPDV